MTSLTSRAASEPPGSADLLVNEVVGVPAGIGATARRARADAYDAWLARLLPVALLAVGGLGRRQCAPYGDLDLVLVHAGVPGIDELAAALWYPIWDAGLRLDHSVRTVAEALSVAQDDVKVALGLLDARLVAGDPDLADTLVSSATDHWRRTAVRQLAPLRESTAARWQAHGELAHLLEGDLKEAAGGLRDVGILRAIATAGITDALRPAVHAAHLRLLDTRDALHQQVGRRVDRLLAQERCEWLAAYCPPLPTPWPAEARAALTTLLGAGTGMIPAWETCDRYGLIDGWLPEWTRLRSLPQHNPVHRFTLDRHLVQTAAEASRHTRDVDRPDLLLLGALLHDVGKGLPGDHSVVGAPIAEGIATRIGLPAAEATLIGTLVRLHLVLPEVATRRDLSDPVTIARVAESVGDVTTLDLLYALVRADAAATGPAAWSDWKGRLVAELVARVRTTLDTGDVPAPPAPDPALVAGPLPVVHLTGDRVSVAAADRRGLLATVAGCLALHRLEVLAADASTVDGRALVQCRVQPRYGLAPDPVALSADLRRAVRGDVRRRHRRGTAGTAGRRRRRPALPGHQCARRGRRPGPGGPDRHPRRRRGRRLLPGRWLAPGGRTGPPGGSRARRRLSDARRICGSEGVDRAACRRPQLPQTCPRRWAARPGAGVWVAGYPSGGRTAHPASFVLIGTLTNGMFACLTP